MSIAIFFSALHSFSLKFSLLLPRLLSRISLLKFLKFRRLFSPALSCSLSRCSSLIKFPSRKTRVAKCNAATRFHAKENWPNTPVPSGCPASPPPPRQSVRADVRDVIAKISIKSAYRWLLRIFSIFVDSKKRSVLCNYHLPGGSC